MNSAAANGVAVYVLSKSSFQEGYVTLSRRLLVGLRQRLNDACRFFAFCISLCIVVSMEQNRLVERLQNDDVPRSPALRRVLNGSPRHSPSRSSPSQRKPCAFGAKCKQFLQHKEPHCSIFTHTSSGFLGRLQTSTFLSVPVQHCPVHDKPDGSRDSPLNFRDVMHPDCTCRSRPVRRLFKEELGEPEIIMYLVRHGERLDKIDPFFVTTSPRPFDPPLTDVGKVQAQKTGEILRREKIDAIFVSPFLRCVQTAAGIADRVNEGRTTAVPVILHAGVSELLFRKWFPTEPLLLTPPQLAAESPYIAPERSVCLPQQHIRREALNSPTTAMAALSMTEERDVESAPTRLALAQPSAVPDTLDRSRPIAGCRNLNRMQWLPTACCTHNIGAVPETRAALLSCRHGVVALLSPEMTVGLPASAFLGIQRQVPCGVSAWRQMQLHYPAPALRHATSEQQQHQQQNA